MPQPSNSEAAQSALASGAVGSFYSLHLEGLDKKVTGSAYSLGFKALALCLVLGMTYWFGLLVWQAKLAFSQSIGWFSMLAAWALLIITLIAILRSQTTISPNSIEQSWIWSKKIDFAHIALIKWIHIKGLSWLIAPRLYTRSVSGKVTTFYVAEPSMWPLCEQIVAHVKKPKM